MNCGPLKHAPQWSRFVLISVPFISIVAVVHLRLFWPFGHRLAQDCTAKWGWHSWDQAWPAGIPPSSFPSQDRVKLYNDLAMQLGTLGVRIFANGTAVI